MFSKFITSLAGQLFAVLLGLAIISACSMKPANEMPATNELQNKLQNTHWELKSLTGYQDKIEQIPTLDFMAERLSGFNGCNRIFASYATGPDGSIAFSQMGSTRMACPGQGAEIEKLFNQALTNSRLFAISRDALNLMDAKRNVLLVLTPKPPE